METQTITTYESKHVKCGVEDVQAVINQHQLFFWEMMGTNTIVSRDTHLEDGGIFDSDSIYSVTRTERFSTIDFRRPKDLPRISEIRSVEQEYFSIVSQLENLGCSAQNNYSTSPPRQPFSWFLFFITGGWYFIYYFFFNKKHAKAYAEWNALKAQLQSIVNTNRQLLNG